MSERNSPEAIERRKQHALEIQANLEEAGADDSAISVQDIKAGRRVSWNDGQERYIDIIPDMDRRGICVYFYRNGKRTAQIGLTSRAAYVLMDGIHSMLIGDRRFIEQLEKETI